LYPWFEKEKDFQKKRFSKENKKKIFEKENILKRK